MTDRERLYTGLTHAAWGYFLLHFNFNLSFGGSSINILPEFAGLLLLLSAIGKLSSERRDLLLLRPLCILLAVWHGAKWALAIIGISLDDMRFVYLGLIVMAATLYFHFQFLTDMAALAEQYQPEGEELDRRIRNRRTALLVLTTIADLASSLLQGSDFEQLMKTEQPFRLMAVALVFLGVAVVIVVVMIMFSLFQLRRYVRDGDGVSETAE